MIDDQFEFELEHVLSEVAPPMRQSPIPGDLTCPRCRSHKVRIADEDDGWYECIDCGHDWEINPVPQPRPVTLAERLNEGKWWPKETGRRAGSQVTLCRGDPTTGDEIEATSEELRALGVTDAYLAAHPEGVDRGGYVPFVFAGGETAYLYAPEDLGDEWEPGPPAQRMTRPAERWPLG